jgi:hypothetical protein
MLRAAAIVLLIALMPSHARAEARIALSAAKFIVFDACRSELQLPTKDTTKGLVPVAEQQGMFIAYASAPGHTALDRGDNGGPYAEALAAELGTPGLDHLNLFQNVKERVLASTGGAQQPWESNGLGRRVYLTGEPKPTSRITDDAEVSELAKRLQQTLKNYGCYHGNVDGVWNESSERSLALFARENGAELEGLKPTVENIIKVEGGVSAGCPSLGQNDKNGLEVYGCAPKSDVHVDILSEPDPAKPHPDAPGIGTSWSLVDAQVIANSKGRYLYGRLTSHRFSLQSL